MSAHDLIDAILRDAPLTTHMKRKFAALDVNVGVLHLLYTHWSPLEAAARHCRVDYVQWLLQDMKADPNFETFSCMAPIVAVIASLRRTEIPDNVAVILKLLLRNGATTRLKDVLHTVRYCDDATLFRLLYRSGAHVGYISNHTEMMIKVQRELDACKQSVLLLYGLMRYRMPGMRDLAPAMVRYAWSARLL